MESKESHESLIQLNITWRSVTQSCTVKVVKSVFEPEGWLGINNE